MLPQKLQKKLDARKAANAFRNLPIQSDLIDFASNDYLGFGGGDSALSYSAGEFAKAISEKATAVLESDAKHKNGASGSRLITGNHLVYERCEKIVAHFHESETALIYNSGYDANIGFFQSVPQRGDLILYDAYIHASIRDGISMSKAQNYKWNHNDITHLEQLLDKHSKEDREMYVVTESVFSMDGDTPDLEALVNVCKKYTARCIVDEAHATAVMGKYGQGAIQNLDLHEAVFARIVTFGKGIGAHGAAILCDSDLRDYLINFSRSFIYTTALPPHSVATVLASYTLLNDLKKTENTNSPLHHLKDNIRCFQKQLSVLELEKTFIKSDSSIHCAIVPGNKKVKKIAQTLQESRFNVKPILSPTVAEGEERLRFCLHAFNTDHQIKEVLALLKENLS